MRTALRAVSLSAILNPYPALFHYSENLKACKGPEASFSSLLWSILKTQPFFHPHRSFTSTFCNTSSPDLSRFAESGLPAQGTRMSSNITHAPPFFFFPFLTNFLLLYGITLIWYFSCNLFQQGLSQTHFLPTNSINQKP